MAKNVFLKLNFKKKKKKKKTFWRIQLHLQVLHRPLSISLNPMEISKAIDVFESVKSNLVSYSFPNWVSCLIYHFSPENLSSEFPCSSRRC